MGDQQPEGNGEEGVDRRADAALIARIQRGDDSAFEELVRWHSQTVFAVALRMLGDAHEAEDVAQDVFVRASRGVGAFRGAAKVSTWLLAITMNLCRNRRRWWSRHRRLIAASLDEPVGEDAEPLSDTVADPSPSPAQSAQASERRRIIETTLQALEAAAREVVVLRDLQGYSYEDMAALLRGRVGTVKSRLSRARMQLRALLTSERVSE